MVAVEASCDVTQARSHGGAFEGRASQKFFPQNFLGQEIFVSNIL